ncbi:CapA family protein [Xanthovirga aplysinae]|uniref:CapA family protein n=1 Tax=Xanthovirga aplysinae TaxID=2529853 RepID=UPI0012BCA7C9|nr:CapA family protein [Xanthovirga aplysinae]MTI29513.1 CapA family protein [Xanthovirga aplysinae]
MAVSRFLREKSSEVAPITLFLCGDVMTGRGIDQILPHPSNPQIHESYLKSAKGYLELAENANGQIPWPVDYSYIWGGALAVLDQFHPDLRIINLETAVTASDDFWKDKGINYRMSPANVTCLTQLKVDVCALANNHLLDWGYSGLKETISTLNGVDIKTVGAGSSLQKAQEPLIIEVSKKGRVVIFAYAMTSSGVPSIWAASEKEAGINFLKDFSSESLLAIKENINKVNKKKGDILLFSIHWGGNWGYQIYSEQRQFAHQLIDEMGVDIIYGHSSHHIKGIEVYKNKPILYGCGDFIDDYEGIRGYEEFRDDLSLIYLLTMEPSTGYLLELRMVPMHTKHFKINRASKSDTDWLEEVLSREGKPLGTSVFRNEENTFFLEWR